MIDIHVFYIESLKQAFILQIQHIILRARTSSNNMIKRAILDFLPMYWKNIQRQFFCILSFLLPCPSVWILFSFYHYHPCNTYFEFCPWQFFRVCWNMTIYWLYEAVRSRLRLPVRTSWSPLALTCKSLSVWYSVSLPPALLRMAHEFLLVPNAVLTFLWLSGLLKVPCLLLVSFCIVTDTLS